MNLQNIPSHNKDIRKMFKATDNEYKVFSDNDFFEVEPFTEIYTESGWKYSDKLTIGDILVINEESAEYSRIITSVDKKKDKIVIGIV